MVDLIDHEPIPVEHESLVGYLETNPEVGLEIFNIINDSLQEILPGAHHYHERYRGISEVGLAIAVARPEKFPDSGLNPLGWEDADGVYFNESQNLLIFSANNQETSHDTATWAWKDTDEAILGGKLTEEAKAIGRFAVVATAKINHLTNMPEAISSHWVGGMNVGEGKVGVAGAKAVGTPETGGISLVATSGLWEVHDHIVSAVFSQAVDEVRLYREAGNPLNKADIKEFISGFIYGELLFEIEKVDQMVTEQGKAVQELSEDRAAINNIIRALEADYALNLA